MSLKRILYISAGSKEWGIGHLLRSSQVIASLRNEGISVISVALVPNNTDALKIKSFLKFYDITVLTLDEIDTKDLSVVVVDVNDGLQEEMLIWLRRTKLKAFALDWYIDDNVINNNKINLRHGAEAFKYCIIREEFHRAKTKYISSTTTNDLVVVLGGGDKRGHLSNLLNYINEDEFYCNRQIVVIIGPMIDDSKFSDIRKSNNLSLLKSPGNIADIMASTRVGISNGGGSLMEFTMLGIPTIVFPQTLQEEMFVKPFINNGSSLMGSVDRYSFKYQLNKLLENRLLRSKMSEKAKKLIDGFGVKRITTEIISFLGD